MKYSINIIIICISITILCSCDLRMVYDYTISNKYANNVFLEVYPLKKVEEDPEYNGNWLQYYEPYLTNNAKEDEEQDFLFEIHSTGSITFSYLSNSTGIFDKNHDKKHSRPLWLQHNCIRKIYVKSDNDYTVEIPVEYWSDSSNWIKQKEAWDLVEFTLIIDDEVIREHSSPAE